MQLINPAIYDRETQARTKAIEETRKFKAQQRDELEKAKVVRHVEGFGAYQPTSAPNATASKFPSTVYKISIHDVPFQVVNGGSKLVRLSGELLIWLTARALRAGLQILDDPSPAKATPKKVDVGGVTFIRSKNGNLHRLGAVKSKRWVVVNSRRVDFVHSSFGANILTLKERRTCSEEDWTLQAIHDDGYRTLSPPQRLYSHDHLALYTYDLEIGAHNCGTLT